jgi:hypothetical protein
MAKLTLRGETYDVRPLTLFDLKSVGQAIDRINARSKREGHEQPSFGETLEIATDLLTVISAGIEGEDADGLERKADAGDLQGLWATYSDVVREAGIGRQAGEAQPAQEPAKPSRSRSASRTS